jgi:hypothetical protein
MPLEIDLGQTYRSLFKSNIYHLPIPFGRTSDVLNDSVHDIPSSVSREKNCKDDC